MEIIKTLSLDFQELEVRERVNVRKNDLGRLLRLLLFDGGIPCDPGDAGAALVVRSPSGAVYYEPCRAEGSVLYAPIREALTREPGEMGCEVTLHFPDGRQLTSPGFTIQVEDTIWDPDQEVVDPGTPARVLLSPPGCQVGQLLKVAQVSEEGTALRLEPCDPSQSAAGGVEPQLPDYWQAHVDSRVEDIRRAMEDAGRNKSAFLFYTDAHWDHGSQVSPKLLTYLHHHTAVNQTIFGGDVVNTEAGDDTVMSYLYDWRRAVRDLPNHHSVAGNHDDGNTTNHLFDTKYIYAFLMAAEETPDILRGGDMYYYIDQPNERTRYLYLDTACMGLDTAQNAFISDALKSTPENWHIVVAAHIWYGPDYSQSSVHPIPIVGYGTGIQNLCVMLDRYNARSGEFADCAGWVEFCIGGHVHRDYDGATPGGIPIILCETDSRHVRGAYTYAAGTISEAAVSGIIADYDGGKVSVVRVGRGESRVVPLPGHTEPGTYTNLLPLAIGKDGEIYNGTGYQADTRLNSSGEEVAKAGVYVTGFIQCSKDDVIYLKNVHMSKSSQNVTSLYIATYGPNFVKIRQMRMDDSYINNFLTYDENGLVTTINPWGIATNGENVNTDKTLMYFRLSADVIDDSSVITVNEPIE